jgi:hypothetical protein
VDSRAKAIMVPTPPGIYDEKCLRVSFMANKALRRRLRARPRWLGYFI